MVLALIGLVCFFVFRVLNGIVRRIVGGTWSDASANRFLVTTVFLIMVVGYFTIGVR